MHYFGASVRQPLDAIHIVQQCAIYSSGCIKETFVSCVVIFAESATEKLHERIELLRHLKRSMD